MPTSQIINMPTMQQCQRCGGKVTDNFDLVQQQGLLRYVALLRRNVDILAADVQPLIEMASTHSTQCCQPCFAQAINALLEAHCAQLTHAQTLDFASQFRRNKELLANIDYTIENGFYVFIRWFHLKRGECCENRCRHCPYTDWNQYGKD